MVKDRQGQPCKSGARLSKEKESVGQRIASMMKAIMRSAVSRSAPVPGGSAEGLALHRVFRCLHGARPDDLSGGLGLKHRGLFCERVDAFSLLGSRLLYDNELGEAGDNKGAVLLQFFVTDGR